MTALRKTGTVLLASVGALMLLVALTVPLVAATAPAVLGMGAMAGAWLVWPKRPTP
jgi:hypothetical protein